MLSPTDQRNLTFLSLSGDQKEMAAGRFSATYASTADDTARLLSYFDPDMTTTTRKFILGSSPAILFLEHRTFKVLSSPSITIDRDNRQTFTGHFGDKLIYPNPISISGDLAALDVLVLAKKPDDEEASLNAFFATHAVTETANNPDDPDVIIEFPFPDMSDNEDPHTTFATYHVARLPVTVPLPMGHGIDSASLDDEDAISQFFDALRSIAPHLAEWAQALIKTTDFWDDKSLSAADLFIPEFFLEGLSEPNPVQGTIYTLSKTVSISTPAGQAVVNRVESARNSNIDAWIKENPNTYHQLVGQFGASQQSVPPPPPTAQVSTVATIVKTRADKNDEVRMLKSKAILQLLLAREGTNSDGAPILIPGELDLSAEDLLQETPRNAFRNLLMLFRTKIETKKEREPMHLMYYSAHFPYIIINPIFTAAFLSGHWATEPIHKDDTSIGQNLGIFTFAPTKTNTAEHKRQLEETNSILGEDLVSASSSQRTKASLTLFDGGNVQFHSHALSTIANFHAAIAVIDNQDQAGSAVSTTCLQEAFSILAQPDMKQWVDRFARGSTGEHLPYALILDLHNSFIHLAKMITDPRWIRAVINNEEIPASAFEFFKATHSSVLAKWQKAVASDTLGPYVSAPSTWIAPKAKEHAKKSAKTTDASSPGNSSNTNRSGTSSGPDRRQQNARNSGSDPNLGLISAPDNIRNGPQMSSGKRLCMAFARKGKSCTNQSYSCPGAHVTLKNASLADLQTLDRWIADTANVSWANGRPFRLNEAQPATSTTPSAAPVTTPVSPDAAASRNPVPTTSES